MKAIGILGGVSYQSTIKYYERLNMLYSNHFNNKTSCPCIIYNLNFEKIFYLQNHNKWNEIFEIIKDGSEHLKEAEADFFIIPSITLHKLHKNIRAEIELPFLSFLDILLNELLKANTKTLGILGTKITMEGTFIKDVLSEYKIESLIPSEYDRKFVDEMIFTRLAKGIFNDKDIEKLNIIINRLLDEGVEKILLGCTEIPFLMKDQLNNTKLIDPISLHCKAIFEYSIND